MPHRDTSLAIKPDISIPNNGDDPVLLQPHMDTSLAIKQDISIPNNGDNPVL